MPYKIIRIKSSMPNRVEEEVNKFFKSFTQGTIRTLNITPFVSDGYIYIFIDYGIYGVDYD